MNAYKNKCGSCMNFEYLEIKGKLQLRGKCNCKNRVNYHQASQDACKQYIEIKGARKWQVNLV